MKPAVTDQPQTAESRTARAQEERQGIYLVVIAVFFFSTSPVLIRWAAVSVSAYEIAAGRMLVAGTVVVALALLQRQRLPGLREYPRFALYGLIAALHFGLYILSLDYTTIAHSLALVYTAPVFVAIFSWIFLQEGLSLRKWVGTLIVVAGIAVLAGFEADLSREMMVGDLMALGSAICFGLYSVAGRSQRDRFPLFAYAGSVYSFAALWLLPLAIFNYSAGGYTSPVLMSILGLGLLPLALGHTLYNAALRRTRATLVNLVATQEVTGGVILGILLLNEIPTVNSLVGALITLVGIVLVLL
jgi:drug/metabolite transporter (DMT)-like permease